MHAMRMQPCMRVRRAHHRRGGKCSGVQGRYHVHPSARMRHAAWRASHAECVACDASPHAACGTRHAWRTTHLNGRQPRHLLRLFGARSARHQRREPFARGRKSSHRPKHIRRRHGHERTRGGGDQATASAAGGAAAKTSGRRGCSRSRSPTGPSGASGCASGCAVSGAVAGHDAILALDAHQRGGALCL